MDTMGYIRDTQILWRESYFEVIQSILSFFLYSVQISRKTKTNSFTEAKVVSISSFLQLSVDKQL